MQAQNVTDEVIWALATVYAILLLVTLASVIGSVQGWFTKLAWLVLAACLPIVGIAAYCIRCLVYADYSFLNQFGWKSKSKKVIQRIREAQP